MPIPFSHETSAARGQGLRYPPVQVQLPSPVHASTPRAQATGTARRAPDATDATRTIATRSG